MAKKASIKKAKTTSISDKVVEKKGPAETAVETPEQKVPKKRQPRMTQKEIWLVYARIILATDPVDAFDLLARTFEDHNDLNYWLFRVGHGDLKSLRKGHDWIEFLRLVATRLYQITRADRIRR